MCFRKLHIWIFLIFPLLLLACESRNNGDMRLQLIEFETTLKNEVKALSEGTGRILIRSGFKGLMIFSSPHTFDSHEARDLDNYQKGLSGKMGALSELNESFMVSFVGKNEIQTIKWDSPPFAFNGFYYVRTVPDDSVVLYLESFVLKNVSVRKERETEGVKREWH